MRQGRKDHQRPSKQLGQPYTARTVARHVAENAVVLVIGLPLALWGIVTHGVPDRLTGVAVRWLERTVEEEATYKIVAGAVLYPFCWVLEGWGVRRLLCFSSCPRGCWPWRGAIGSRVRRQAQAFVRFLGDRGLHRWRRALVEDLGALARLVPESVRADAAEDDN